MSKWAILGFFRRLFPSSNYEGDIKTPHVTCPRCRLNWVRKPSKVELLAEMSGQISMKQLLFVYRNYCVGCDKRFKSIGEATIDHIQPKSKGGTNGLHNYQLLCRSCNIKKGSHFPLPDHTFQLKHLLDAKQKLELENLK